jgi:hypothetical protein
MPVCEIVDLVSGSVASPQLAGAGLSENAELISIRIQRS